MGNILSLLFVLLLFTIWYLKMGDATTKLLRLWYAFAGCLLIVQAAIPAFSIAVALGNINTIPTAIGQEKITIVFQVLTNILYAYELALGTLFLRAAHK